MQKLQTVNAETLLYEPLEKPSFVVDSLIPTGLSLFWLTEDRQELAHAEAVLMRVAGNPLMGHDDNGGRCALPLP